MAMSIQGQNKIIDSLEALLEEVSDSVTIGRVYVHLSKEHAMKNPDKAIELAQIAISYHRNNYNQEYLPQALLRLSFAYHIKGQFDDFIKTIDQVKPLVDRPKDKLSLYNQLGMVYDRQNLDSAGHYYRKGVEVAVQENIVLSIPSMLKQVAVVHARKGELGIADSLMQVALSRCIDDRFENRKSDILYNLCVLNSHRGNYENVTKYGLQGYKLALETENVNYEINFLNVLANISYQQGDTTQALGHRLAAIKKMRSSGLVPTAGFNILYEVSYGYMEQDSLMIGKKLAKELLTASNKANNLVGKAKANSLLARAAFKDNDQIMSINYLKSALADTARLLGDAHENAVFIKALDILFAYGKHNEVGPIIGQMERNLNHNYHVVPDKNLWLAKYKYFKHQKKYLQALVAHEKFHDVAINYKNQTTQSELIHAKVKFDAERKQFELEKKEQEILFLKKLNIERNKQFILGALTLLALFSIIYLIRSWKFARIKNALQKTFTKNLIQGHEKERKRLARELHDSVGQSLVLLKNQLVNDPVNAALVGNILDEIRSVSRGLHPFVLEKYGLKAAVEKLIEEVDERAEIFFDLELDSIDDVVPKEKQLHIFRIIQESVTNLIKYSKSPSAQIQIKKLKEKIDFVVRDFGVGMTTNDGMLMNSLGMKTMAERASIVGAHLNIQSAENTGTSVTLSMPIA